MRKTRKVAIFVLAAAACVSYAGDKGAEAEKGLKVFINDVDVTGIANQTFKGCSVTFDADNNVHIDAPNYKITKVGDSGEGSPPPSGPAGPVKNKYFLVTEENQGSKVWDDYSLAINGDVIKKFKSSDGILMEDITKYVTSGKNQMMVMATKKDKYPGGSATYWYRVIIGQGHEEDKKIVIDKTLLEWTRKGSDTDPGNKSVTIEAQ